MASAGDFKTVLMILFVTTIILWLFGEIAMFNCNAVNQNERPAEPIEYLTTLFGSLFSPCSNIPLWLVVLILAPMAIVILLWGVAYVASFIPFVGG